MRGALILMIVVGGLIGSLRSRYIALLLYVWFALFRPQEWAWGALSSLRLSMVIWLALMIPALATGVLPNITHPLSIATVAFLMCAGLAQFHAVSPETGWIWLQVLLTTTSVALLAVTIIKTRQQLLGFLAVVGGSIGFHAAKFGAGFLYNGGIKYTDGIGGVFGGNNEFALAIAQTIFLVIAAAQNTTSKWLRRFFVLAVPLSMFAVISTFSRGGFLGLAAGALVFAALQRHRILTTTALVGGIVVVLAAAPIPDEYFNRLQTIRTYEEVQEGSALSRLHVWRVALEVARKNPFGVGVKNFELVYDQYDFLDGQFGRMRAVHNTPLQVLTETGIAGGTLYILLLTSAVWVCWRTRRRALTPGLSPEDRKFMITVPNALIASVAAFVVGGMFASQMLNDLTWFTIALAASTDRVSRGIVAATVDSTAPKIVRTIRWSVAAQGGTTDATFAPR